jgi:hypothetical protein
MSNFIRHLCPFAKADVNLACVIYGLDEARCQLDGIFHDLLYPAPQRCEAPEAVEPSVLMEAAAELLPIAARLAHESVVGIQAALDRCPIMRLIENWQGGGLNSQATKGSVR